MGKKEREKDRKREGNTVWFTVCEEPTFVALFVPRRRRD